MVEAITVTGSEKEIITILRKALDRGMAMMPYERQMIEEEFLRLVRCRMRKKLAVGVEVGHGQ